MSIPLKERARVLAFIGVNTATYFTADYAGASLDALDRLVTKAGDRVGRLLVGAANWCYDAKRVAERNLHKVERMAGR